MIRTHHADITRYPWKDRKLIMNFTIFNVSSKSSNFPGNQIYIYIYILKIQIFGLVFFFVRVLDHLANKNMTDFWRLWFLDSRTLPCLYSSRSYSTTKKFLGSLRVWWNCVLSSHIHDGPYHEFNERTPPWMWEKRIPFSVLREYLRITLNNYVKLEGSKRFCRETYKTLIQNLAL